MKKLIYLLAIFFIFITGCRADRIDISRLEPEYRILFTQAAEMEGFEVTLNGDYFDSVVEYNNLNSNLGNTINIKHDMGLFVCKIQLDIKNINSTPCNVEDLDQRFIMVSRHELRHCQDIGHSNNPSDLMYPVASCYPKN